MIYLNEIDPFCAQWLQNLMDAARNAIVPQAAAEFIRASESAVADFLYQAAA